MSDSATEMPIQPVPDDGDEFGILEMSPAVGWVVHKVVGKPQQTEGIVHWAWCRVTTEGPGYTDIVFTESDGTTVADPYPHLPATADRPVKLGEVLFKVFC